MSFVTRECGATFPVYGEERGIIRLQLFRSWRVLGDDSKKLRAVDASGIGSAYVAESAAGKGESMSVNDLPAIMGTILIVAGLGLVGVSALPRAERSKKTAQVGALIIVVGAFLLGLSIFVSHGR